MEEEEEELNSSILGSYEFWNNLYNDERENFLDHGDVGEIWFGKDTARRIIKWISDNPNISKNDKILDIGCGNGMLLIEMSKKGFINLQGMDYSKNAIDLASAIAEKERCSIFFFVGNILKDSLEETYSVALDKGTYDAISLDPEDAKTKRGTYIATISKILSDKGFFVITSCNWTESELKNHFNELEYVETLPAPAFKFGGKVGKTVSTVVFRKR